MEDRDKAKEYLETILDEYGTQWVISEEAEDILIDMLRKERGEIPLFTNKSYNGV
jgi:hypothetical protein